MNTSPTFYDMEISEPWATHIFNGKKTKEVRKGGGRWSNVSKGDYLNVNAKGADQKMLFRVISVTKYKNIEECLKIEGVSNLLPGIDSFEEGLQVYLGFDGDENAEQRRKEFEEQGAIAIELEKVTIYPEIKYEDDGLMRAVFKDLRSGHIVLESVLCSNEIPEGSAETLTAAFKDMFKK